MPTRAETPPVDTSSTRNTHIHTESPSTGKLAFLIMIQSSYRKIS